MKFVNLALIALFLPLATTRAAVMRIEWSGTIDGLTEFQTGAAPDGISMGMAISGFTDYDATYPHELRSILGSHTYGDIYRFEGLVLQVVTAGDLEWRTEGADLTFTGWSYESRESFDVFMTSDRNSVLAFPNYAGNAQVGFFAWDDTDPLLLYDSRLLDDPGFDFTQFTDAGGSIGTQFFDGNGDITDGYYLSFHISSISISTIPEPSVCALICASLTWLILVKKRRRAEPSHPANPRNAGG